jgi:CheY-like chemotaxis protein
MDRILVVDDDEATCEVLELALTDEGHHVRYATSIERALKLATEHPPDAILFDMMLSDGDGGQFIDRYRQLPHSNARLIAVSGIANLAEQAAKVGADAALLKPFDLDDVLSLVSRATVSPCGD